MHFLKKLDSTGVPIYLKHNHEEQYKSVFGGLLTLLIYAACLCNAIQVFILWGNGSLLPKIQIESQMNEMDSFRMENGTVQLRIIPTQVVDPLDPNAIILLPIIRKWKSSVEVPLISSQSNIVTLDSFDFYFNTDIKEDEQKFQLALIKCVPNKLKGVGQCASQEKIDEYFTHQPIALELSMIVQSYDSKTRRNKDSKKSKIFIIEDKTSLYGQIFITKSNQLLSDSIFFDEYRKQEILNKFNMQLQSFAASSYFTDSPLLALIAFRLDNISLTETIQYPKLGEVLAQIGSIMQVLMFIRIFGSYYNQQSLSTEILHEMIKFYYPTFQQVRISKSLSGKITKVTLKNRELNLEQFNKFYTECINKMKNKLNFINQLNEMSRIQLFLLQQFDKDKILKLLQMMKFELPVGFLEEEPQVENQSLHIVSGRQLDPQNIEVITSNNNINNEQHIMLDLDDINVFSN